MALCPACARGSHTDHTRSGVMSRAGSPTKYVCPCAGDCLSEPEHLRRLVAAGVIAPMPVRRGD